uniref:Protein kinase domain-containing protein n=1 Tax=Steinernema glaseri TaxID=37863 RepID=A0A1I7YGC0_9BILA
MERGEQRLWNIDYLKGKILRNQDRNVEIVAGCFGFYLSPKVLRIDHSRLISSLWEQHGLSTVRDSVFPYLTVFEWTTLRLTHNDSLALKGTAGSC